MALSTDSTVKFDAFAEEHECLEQTLAGLRELLAGRQDAGAAIDKLAEFCEHVLTHFVHEEQDDGFFDNVVEQAPRLKIRATTLITEHATMAETLTELRLLASREDHSQQWWSGLNDGFEAFWKMFCRHERAEIDLVQEAFHDDIGPAD